MQRVKVKVKGKRRCVNESMFFTIANGGKRKKTKEGMSLLLGFGDGPQMFDF